MSLNYIPAGLYPDVFMSESTLYTKMLRKGKFRSSVDFYSDPKHRFTWLKLFDRDVYLVRNTAHVPDIDFDFSYNMSIFGKDNVYEDTFQLRDVLISAHNGMHELKKWRKNRWRPQNKRMKVLGDSGGAQLRAGTTDFVDPKGVISWYNDQVDWGIALDIPPRPCDMGNMKTLFALAEVQRRNNELFVARRRPDLKLLNAVHGYTLDDMRKYIDFTKNKEFNGWAIGTDNVYSGISNFTCLLLPHMEYGDLAHERTHVMGASGKQGIPVLAWISAKKVDYLTVDSTNFLRGNRYRRYIHIDLNGKLHEIDMTPTTNKLTPRQRLPCPCPVCQSIGWWDAFMMDGSAKAQHLLTAHNLFTILRFVQFWNVSAKNLTRKEYDALIRKVFPRSFSSILVDMDYVDYAMEHGLDKAGKKYRMWFVNEPQKHSMPKLFEGEGKVSNFEKMVTFVGLAQKGSSAYSVLKYIGKQDIINAWKAAGIKDLSFNAEFFAKDENQVEGRTW